jgi:hypothetical protein
MNTPDYISPIVGYRVWQWDNDGLHSLNGEPWFPNRPLVASCRAFASRTIAGRNVAAHSANPAPQENCSCGVYAAKTLEHLRGTQYWQYGIHGEINLWGTIVEHERGWRAQFAYPKSLFLPHDTFPFTFATILSRLKSLLGYRADIFVADLNGNIPLWANDSGYDSAGLDYLIEKSKQYYDRRRQERTLKKADRVALLGVGIAVVERVDNQHVHAVLRNRHALKIPHNDIAWDEQNMRWEASLGGLHQTKTERISKAITMNC